MRKIKKLCRSVLSGTLAMAIISSNAVLPLTAHGAETEDTDVQSASGMTGEAEFGFETDGSIVFTEEEETEASDTEDTAASTADPADSVPAAAAGAGSVSMAEENGYRYYITGGNAVIDSYTGEETSVEVPAALGGAEVTEIGYAAFAGNESIVSVRLPETVRRINHDAFSGCTALVHAELPDGIISIQDGAFSGCEVLSEINIPEAVSRIEDNVFSGCSLLADITLPDNIDYIGKSAFSGCTALTSFSIPESVTAVGNLAFSGSGLESLEIPDTVTSMGYSVFADCISLKEIVLPKDITALKAGEEKGMFSGCSALELVTFPENLTEIGDMAFAACSSLECFALPETVTVIGTDLFKDCEKLEQITIPQSVTRIEDGMFSGCTSLPSVDLHDKITYIGSSAFAGCKVLNQMDIPESTAVIGDSCFFDCDSLTQMDIPASVTSLGAAALAGCDILESVTLPDGIETFGSTEQYGLFTGDIALKTVKLPASLKDIGAYTFKNCVSVTEIALPASVSGIGSSAFEGCISLREITLPSGVVRLSDKAFSGCSTMTAAILPKGFDEAGDYAFENCGSLTALGKQAGFFKFGENTFTGCVLLNDERATVFRKNSPVVNVSTAASIVGGVANFSIKYDLNDWICEGLAENADIRFEIPVPEGLVLIDSSVVTDSADNKVVFVGNSGNLLSLKKPEGTLRFSAKIEAYNEKDYTIDPKILFDSHAYSWSQKIPRMSLTVPKITISSQNTVSDLSCEVYGIAEPDRKVKIYVDGVPAAAVTSNPYTGKYTAVLSLPEKKDSVQYGIYAECGVNRTEEISVIYSDARPAIRKVELIYCTHAPTNLSDYMEKLDITGVFTRGERPVIQFYPKGNMRFRIEADHAEKIQVILVKSTKGSEIKYLRARYDEKEDAFITSPDEYFDESNHNYVPGSLNFVLIEKTANVIRDTDADYIRSVLEFDKINREYEIIDDSSCICSIMNNNGERITDCYYNMPETVEIGGENVSANTIAQSAGDYGFEDTGKKVQSNGETYSLYTRSTHSGSTNTEYDNSVLNTVDSAYSTVRTGQYEIGDYYVNSQLMVPTNSNSNAVLMVTAAAEKPGSYGTGLTGNGFVSQYSSTANTSSGQSGSSSDNNNNTGNIANTISNPFDFSDPLGSLSYYGGKTADFLITLGEIDNDLDPLGMWGGELIEDVSNVSTLYSQFGYVASAADFAFNWMAAEQRYQDEISNYQGDSARDQYRRDLAETRRNTAIFLSLAGNAVGYLPVLGEGYSMMLGAIGDDLDVLMDKIGEYHDQLALLDEVLDELLGSDTDGENGGYNTAYPNDGKVNTVIDPSGIVYEGVKSKTVSGAVVTCYVLNEDTGAWEVWNAEDYDQQNPLITDEAGSYAWDVPEGRYYVICEMDGCDSIKSEEFTVAPPKYDLDFNLLNPSAPAVKGYTLRENAVIVSFTKVMDIETVNTDSVSLEGISGDITVEPQLYAADDKYTDSFMISGDFRNAVRFTLTVSSSASDYTGTALISYSAEIDNIYADLILNTESIRLIIPDTYQITANKEIVSYTSADPEIAAVDESGLVKALSEGTTTVTAIDGGGKEAVITVSAEIKLEIDEKTADRLELQSRWDYLFKTGEQADSAECKIVDNKCIIELRDENGNLLDVYTLNPATGIGTDSDGEAVNLPQTGNNTPESLLWVFAALTLMCAGLFAVKASGVILRKRQRND